MIRTMWAKVDLARQQGQTRRAAGVSERHIPESNPMSSDSRSRPRSTPVMAIA
ncbi:hypothetical protein [Stenotrophomonas sp.]|uniref:hypothetical protein n=1 Tax=Stenotrophomonas sp. TaxID=69392 RepID=UPI0028ADD090|nr:hypothetical protein [Stenotrophomonas sp.]